MSLFRPLFLLCVTLLLALLLLVMLALLVGALLPGGGWLAFASTRSGSDWDIYLLDRQRRIVWPLTDNPLPNHDLYPAWSPAGRLLFMSSRGGNYSLYTMDALGGSVARVTPQALLPLDNSFGIWSPDGRRIVFASQRNGDAEIYVMNADGRDLLRLTHNDGYDGFPSWTADGRAILFSSFRGEDHVDVYQMDAALGDSQLVNLSPQPGDDFAPRASPDGRFIVYYSNRDGNLELYSARTDGTQPRRLTDNPGDDIYPAWLPDSSGVLFSSNRSGDEEIYLLRLADGQPVGDPINLTQNPALDRFGVWWP
ncbi:MAG: PD40 domain-containing protein [Chloroflexi bacterium]|nr:PD40 domain-containing protein [Chloroflexota bacterium]